MQTAGRKLCSCDLRSRPFTIRHPSFDIRHSSVRHSIFAVSTLFLPLLPPSVFPLRITQFGLFSLNPQGAGAQQFFHLAGEGRAGEDGEVVAWHHVYLAAVGEVEGNQQRTGAVMAAGRLFQAVQHRPVDLFGTQHYMDAGREFAAGILDGVQGFGNDLAAGLVFFVAALNDYRRSGGEQVAVIPEEVGADEE